MAGLTGKKMRGKAGSQNPIVDPHVFIPVAGIQLHLSSYCFVRGSTVPNGFPAGEWGVKISK